MQQLLNLPLLVAVDDGSERGAQVGQRIEGTVLGGLDERGDGYPVGCSGTMTSKECALPVQVDRQAYLRGWLPNLPQSPLLSDVASHGLGLVEQGMLGQ